MSFTSTVKNEVSKLDTQLDQNISELSGILKNISSFGDTLKIATENASLARRIFNLIKLEYNITPKVVVRRGYNFNKNYIYLLEIHSNLEEIKTSLSLNKIVPDKYIVADEELSRAYLRGVFLAVGSINDPKKSRYHLEFIVQEKEYALFLVDLLNKFKLNSKYIKRDNKYMVYMKEAEKIGDFLRIINATSAVFYYEDIRIYRDHKNMTNRLNNCEQANVDKMIETASKQVKSIDLLIEKGLLDVLDEKVKQVAMYRKMYPEVSLQELSEIITYETGKPITKSGIYHRLKKIEEIVSKIK